MPNVLLAFIWIAVAAVTLLMVDFQVLKIDHVPAAQRLIRKNMRAFAGAVVLLGVLYAMAGTTLALPAAFRPICFIGYLVIAAIFAWDQIAYARKHAAVAR